VHVDALGSMFALRKGRGHVEGPGRARLATSIPSRTGGKVRTAVLGNTGRPLEVVSHASMTPGSRTETPICIVNWTNEEGSRFAAGDDGRRRLMSGDFNHR